MTDIENDPLVRIEREAARLQAAGAEGEAVKLCFQGLTQFGDTVGLLSPLASIFLRHGDLARASDYLSRLAVLSPRDVTVLSTLANVLMAQERNAEAVIAYGDVLELEPDHPTSLVNVGMLLVKMQRAEEAIAPLERVILQPDAPPVARTWLGFAYSAQNRPEAAIDCYEAVVDDPEQGPAVWMPLAIAYRDLRRMDDANRVLDHVLSVDPEHAMARFARAQNHLIIGDFVPGFAGYESRWNRPGVNRPQASAPLWRGEPLEGKSILIVDEQGFGDCIQFCRFLMPLKELGATVLFQVRPKLRQLLDGLEGVDEFVEAGHAGADYYLSLMSLPHVLGVTAEMIPSEPYLHVPEERCLEWAGRLGPKRGLRVGLVWQGEPGSQSEVGRSVPYGFIRRLFDLEICEFVILQKFHGRDDLLADRLPENVTDLGEEIDNDGDAFVDTAAVMANLDVMVSSDTAAAHLSGALGVPTYVLLKTVPEWRWMLDRPDSLWYRDMSLLRQKERGDWTPVVDALISQLKARATSTG